MPLFQDIADWAGDIKARTQRPLLELQQELKQQQLNDALDNVLALDAQRRQAKNPQIPLRPQTWNSGDELKLAQQMALAGLNKKEMMLGDLAQDKRDSFRIAKNGLGDNAYAQGNLANGLDISPVRHSGGLTYNRFGRDSTEAILHFTDKLKGEGLEALAKGKQEEMRNQVLADFLTNGNVPGLMKVDAANNKSLFKPERVKVEGADGNATYYNATPNLNGGIDYTPAQDNNGQPLRIAASESATSLEKNIELMKDYGYSGGEALQILTSTRRKTSSQLWEEFIKQASTSPSTGFGSNPEKVKQFATELFTIARPDESIPSMVDKINQGGSASQHQGVQSEDSTEEPLETRTVNGVTYYRDKNGWYRK
ncbi:hypothetical protein NX722_23440 [Endozoicomonas gorgoniicola]|uniref:Uncharacterized protein n=1 Tax=Endozoicomonas gorgoniicola TaxID=1234144 RepID=A0ABT3N1L4_9GAMM|nr:hypothetical protein [Endozoicomonas gorgoniicola]MCW7555521.1 hypothetical protein [Endozoicomonas gorgoniicola]